MRVLVTGGAGFIGSHLCTALRERGDQVRVLDCLDDVYDPALKRRNLCPEDEFLQGDIRDPATVRAALQGVDAVAHLAARAGVRDSLQNPPLYISVNVEGTATLLGEVARAGIGKVLLASSSSVYGARREAFFQEEDRVDRPESPYAASKQAMELFAWSAHLQHGLNLSVCRLFTVYGPRQRPNMAFQKFAAQIREERPVTLFGDGSSVRDYTFVEDAVAGMIAALDRAEGYRVVNLGGGSPVTLLEVVQTLGRCLGRNPRIQFLPPQAGDVPETRADIQVARRWLGWEPKVGLEEGLQRFVDSLP